MRQFIVGCGLCLVSFSNAWGELPTVALDDFLSGVDDRCQYSAALEQFRLALPDTEQAWALLPPQLQAASAPFIIEDEVDYQIIALPIRGTWREVPVELIEFGLGKGNGIHVLVIDFGGSPDRAEAVFGPRVVRSQDLMANDPDNLTDAFTDLIIESERARLVCDLST